jgi:hypothetical protein
MKTHANNPSESWNGQSQRSTRVSIDSSSSNEKVDLDLEETERSNKEDEYLSEKNDETENIPVNMNVSPSPVLSTIDSNKSPRLDTRMLNTMGS